MKEALRAKLAANATIAATAGKVAWVDRPAGSQLPGITLTTLAAGRRYNHQGWDGLNAGWVQADVWGRSPYECLQLARAVIAEMETTTMQSGYEIGPSFLDGERDMDPEDVEGVGLVHRISMDWRVMNRPI